MTYHIVISILALGLVRPAAAEFGSAPAAPKTEVYDAVRDDSSAPPRPSMLDDRSTFPAEVPAPAQPASAPTRVEPETPPQVETRPVVEEKTQPLPRAVREVVSGKRAGAEDEFAFVKDAADNAQQDMRRAAIDELMVFARRYPGTPNAAEALLRRAELLAEFGEWEPALAISLRLIHEFPGSKIELRAKSTCLGIIGAKISRRLRAPMEALVAAPDGGETGARLSALWRELVRTAPDAIYEPVVEEIQDVLVRFPDLKDADALLASLARLHEANKKPYAALLSWRKLLALYPESRLRSLAQMAVADLFADALRDPKKAIEQYQELIEKYPRTEEVLPALQRSAMLFETPLKQYSLAVEMNDKIVALFAKSPAALAALKSTARLQRDRLGSPGDAIKTLMSLSSMHGGADGVEAILDASDIARRNLKDYARQAELLRKVCDDYPNAKQAPQALFDAGDVYENGVRDEAKALEIYKELISKFPSHKLAKRAADRAAKLEPK